MADAIRDVVGIADRILQFALEGPLCGLQLAAVHEDVPR